MKLGALLFTLISLAFFQPAYAQDRLLLSNGDEMQVKVLELGPDSVYFSNLADSTSKKITSLPRAAVFSIKYQNGKVEVMAVAAPEKQQTNSEKIYETGRLEARQNHKATGAYLGTLGTTLLFPIAAPVVGAVITGARIPNNNIAASQPEFKQQPRYMAGYQREARKKKLGNAAAGLATGVATYVALYFMLRDGY